MSGFNAHYFFGNNYLQLMEDSYIKECCKMHPSVFSFGLQGPDIFFYFIVAGFCDRKNLGSLVHVNKTNVFFQNMYHGLTLLDQSEVAVAYLSGFLGHYFLDANTHPYIYGRTGYTEEKSTSYFGRHVFLETDIDRVILEKYSGLKPSEFYQERTIRMNHSESRMVTDLLYYTFKKTYPSVRAFRPFIQGAFYTMPFGCYIFHDSGGRKKAWLRFLEEITLGFPLISPLIPSDTMYFFNDPCNLRHKKWSNPWDQTILSNESYFDLFEKAGEEYLLILKELNLLLTEQKSRLSDSFMKQLGNRSYHSGLDCRIPS